MLKFVPYILIGIRFLLAPFLFWDASDGETSIWFMLGLGFGFLSDIFDGVLARRTHTVTAHLRETDGRVDVWFFLWIALSAWKTHPEVVFNYRLPLLTVFAFQILAWILDWLKYRRFSNYHAYTAKAFGLSLFAATGLWFAYGPVDLLIWCVIVSGLICMLEEIVITLLLPHWTHDVPSILHAFKIKAKASAVPHQE